MQNEELEKFKRETTSMLESAKFPVHKRESDVECLESEDSTNPSKILGKLRDKKDDMLETQVPDPPDNQPLTKRGILSHLASILRPTRDDFAHNCEREADLQGRIWRDKGVEHGSFRPAEEIGSSGLVN